MKNKALHIILLATLAILTTSCYVNRYIPEGSHRLDNTKQTVVMADSSAVPPEIEEALKNSGNYYLQRRNAKVFGIKWLPVGMWIYGIASPSDSSFVGNYFRRLGEAPVVYDEDKAIRTTRQLQGLLELKGCFNSTVTFDTVSIEGKKIAIEYHLTSTQRYMIENVEYKCDNPAVRNLLDKWQSGSHVKPGDYYDQEKLSLERNRIVANLREEGYYKASVENITFQVDTTYSNRQLSIDVNVDSTNLHVYSINNIFIYPNSTSGLRRGDPNLDTTIFNYYTGSTRTFDFQMVRDINKPVAVKDLTIGRSMMLFPGQHFRPSNITATYNSLLNLRNFKYINIDFSEAPSSTDSLRLVDAHVRLINNTKQKISLSLELTNASPISVQDSSENFFNSGNLGIETNLEYQNKNLFGGAELLKLKGTLLLELPKFILQGSQGGFYNNFSTFEVGLDASFDIPDAFPFSSLFLWQNTRPHTLFSIGGSYQYRYWFERILFNTSFGYTWTHRAGDINDVISSNRIHQHQVLPIELTFVRVLNLDDDFATRLSTINDLRIKYKYSSHLIWDARYDYSYSNQRYGTRHNFSLLHLYAESAGNLLSALSHILDGNADSIDVRQFFDVPFSQYVRTGAEFTRYIYHHRRNTLVLRALLGVGIPYGNSYSMPYEKSFFGGGTTTIRAWQLRHLGPGSYDAGGSILERVGDLQLVLNVEERFPIAGIFEGALFSDLGNVWLLNPSPDYPGGELKWGEILKEIAVGIGVGLRVNVSIATIRLDFAIPLYDPGYIQVNRWRPPHWNFSDIVINFGINYPF